MKFDTYDNAKHLMTASKCCVGLHLPPALQSVGSGEAEVAQGLPPNAPRMAFLVDEYPACPESWVRSSGRVKSYFVPVRDGRGVWLNFNDTLAYVPQHVAAVVSIQGINAVTGLPCADPALEQYIDKCPRHKEAFGPDRFCAKCNFKWPKQNYLATTGTPPGLFWLDGFRAADGVIRQYVLTAQKSRGVAQCLIGAERVFALGISFFLSKTLRPAPVVEHRYGIACTASGNHALSWSGSESLMSGESLMNGSGSLMNYGGAENVTVDFMAVSDTALYERKLSAPSRSIAFMAKSVQVKTLEVAAGAKVNQHIYDDPNGLDFWQTEPDGIVVINYVDEQSAEEIINAGKKDVTGSPEGFLQTLPKGN